MWFDIIVVLVIGVGGAAATVAMRAMGRILRAVFALFGTAAGCFEAEAQRRFSLSTRGVDGGTVVVHAPFVRAHHRVVFGEDAFVLPRAGFVVESFVVMIADTLFNFGHVFLQPDHCG